ncbi:MAG: hypothetical protein AAF564_18910 [Bacteroidota bacterium]
MTDLQRTARVAELQSYLRNQPRLKLEFLANMSKLFRDHEIDLSHDVLGSLTLTLDRTRRFSNGHNGASNGMGSANEADGPPPAPTHDGPPPAPTHDGPPPAPTHDGPPPAPTHDGPPPAPTHDGPPPAPTYDDGPPPAPTH